MKNFLGIFITIALLFSTAFANQFADMEKISLKKDEITKIFVKYASYERVFKFRWTLYKNEGLVMFSSYDKDVSQHILYLNNTNQSFKILLKPRGADFYQPPYFLVLFKDFDFKKHKANFEVFLSDKRHQLEVRYSKKVKE
jgi:hypothetical protein